MAFFFRSLRADCHFRRGQLRAAQQRYEEAAREFDQARALHPDLPHLPLHYALLQADQGRGDQVRTWLERALQQQPENPVYRTFQGWLLAEAGALEAARQALAQARAQLPGNRLTLNGEAYLLFRQGHPAEAVARLQEDGLCSNQAMQARLLVELEKAVAHGRLQPLDPASRSPDSPVRLPSSPRRCRKLGLKRLEQGRWGEAAALLERVREREENSPEVAFYLGAAYFEAGRYTDACRVLEKERQQFSAADGEEDPLAGPYWLYLAAAYLRRGQLEKALPCLESIPEREDLEPDTDFLRGLADLLQGRECSARQSFRRALTHDPSLIQRRLADFASRDRKGKNSPQ